MTVPLALFRSGVAAGAAAGAAMQRQANALADAVIRRAVATVLSRVDVMTLLDQVDVDAVVARVNIDAIVERIDLLRLADYVVQGIDLPAIIRASSSSVTVDAVRGVRRRSANADRAVERAVDAVLLRHSPRVTVAPSST